MKKTTLKLSVLSVSMLLFLLTIVACGGGGGGGGGTTGTTGGNVTISIAPKAPTLAPNGVQEFTATVQGTSGPVAFAATAGTITVIDNTHMSYKAPAAVGTYTITANIDGVSSQAVVTVKAGGGNTAPISGTVADDQFSKVGGITVRFMDAAGTVVASAVTAPNGTFSANVPVTAKSFTLIGINLNVDYSSYSYSKLIYDPSIAGCFTRLPVLSAGKALALGPIIIATQQGPPPPPPDGCGA